MSLIDTIRQHYPSPIRLVDAANYVHEKRYCVAGAFAKHLDAQCGVNGFPSTSQLTWMLLNTNPLLGYRRARHYAETVIKRNDLGLFEDAWFSLGKALSYQPKEAVHA